MENADLVSNGQMAGSAQGVAQPYLGKNQTSDSILAYLITQTITSTWPMCMTSRLMVFLFSSVQRARE